MPNELYQYSLALSLMDGVAHHGLPLSEFLTRIRSPTSSKHKPNPHGLGTFKSMRGELIILDKALFQMKSDGGIVHISPTDISVLTPFVQLTDFVPSAALRTSVHSKEHLADLVTKLADESVGGRPTKNYYLAIRVDGKFRSVKTRTAEGQKFRGESLVDVSARQVNQTHEQVKGTLIGFRSPKFAHGVSVAGDHLHFITDDRKRGGHVLGLENGKGDEEVVLQVSVIRKVHMELPDFEDEDYGCADLTLDRERLTQVEG